MKLKNICKVMIETKWNIAYRPKKKDKDILNDTKEMFHILKNSIRYWCADPFVIEEDDKTYIFFEAYDRFHNKGVIGYREIIGNNVGNIRIIINEPYHLSYPYIYFDNGFWYMIPESSMSNKIIRYKAKKFPDIWEKDKVLIDNIPAVDTTVFSHDKNVIEVFTYIQGESFNFGELKFARIYINEKNDIQSIKDINGVKRPAGKIFKKGDVVYRPSQLCTNIYGEAIIFNKIINISNGEYKEMKFKTIKPQDLKVNSRAKIEGIHTYNCSENLEVIDIQTRKLNLIYFMVNTFFYIKYKTTQ